MSKFVYFIILGGLALVAIAVVNVGIVSAGGEIRSVQFSVLADDQANYGVDVNFGTIPAVSPDIIKDKVHDIQSESSVPIIEYTTLPGEDEESTDQDDENGKEGKPDKKDKPDKEDKENKPDKEEDKPDKEDKEDKEDKSDKENTPAKEDKQDTSDKENTLAKEDKQDKSDKEDKPDKVK